MICQPCDIWSGFGAPRSHPLELVLRVLQLEKRTSKSLSDLILTCIILHRFGGIYAIYLFWLQTLAIRKISMKRNPGTNPRRWPAPTHVTLQLAKPSLSTSYCKVARISHYAQTYTDAEFPHSTQSRIIFPLKIARISCTCAQGVHAPTPLALPRDHRSRFSS